MLIMDIISDVQHCFKFIKANDPSISTILDVFLFPFLYVIVFHRISHFMYQLKIPFVPRLISQIMKLFSGIEIHPGAQIGKGFFIDHGTGVVVGQTAIIGNNCLFFQGVTLGGSGKQKGLRHPILGDNIVVGAGAIILGRIQIGSNCKIGAGSVVVKDIPENSTVVGVPGKVLNKKDGLKNSTSSEMLENLSVQLNLIQAEINNLKNEENK